MATAQRDEGLDKLEAFIALLDAAHERLEEGAERLEAAAEELEEHEDDLEDVARAITRGGEGAMALAMMVTTAVAGVTSESESGDDPIAARLAALAELTAALEVYLEEVVIGEAAHLQAEEREELERLAAAMVRLKEMVSALREELRVLQERELDTTRQKEKALAAAECAKAPMIVLAVVLTVIAIVLAVFTVGSTLVLFAVALAIVACVAAVVQALVTIIENLPALLRAMGFDEHADDLSEWMDQDWFKHACMVVLIVAAILSLMGSLGTAASVASMVLVLSAPLMIAMCVIGNVARLLSALNPFD